MGEKYLLVAARFNELISERLVSGALAVFSSHAVSEDMIDVIWVPGAFEVPVVAARAARSGCYSAIVALGAVIRGDTPHFDYVAGQAAAGLMKIGVDTGVPIIFGILTTDTVEQALSRAGLKHGNKGAEAALTALSMTRALSELQVLIEAKKGGA